MTDSREYVVQVYMPFAPPSARPLLLRLEASTTVQETVDLAIEKLRREQAATRDESYTISAAANSFRLWIAAGDGTPLPRTHPLPRSATLRTCEGLAFPFMLHLNREEAPDRSAEVDVDLMRQPIASRQASLALREAEVLEQRRRTIEATREANIAAIEATRRRSEEAAIRHSERYDMQRRASLQQQRAAEEQRRIDEERQTAAAAQRASIAAAEVDVAARLGPTDLEEERLRLRQAEERAREAALEAWESKRRDVEAQKQQQREAARRRQDEERGRRIQRSLGSILGDLDAKCSAEADEQTSHMDAERLSRAHVLGADEDTRTIALVEHRRLVDGHDHRAQRWSTEDRRTAQQEALRVATSNAEAERMGLLERAMDKWSIEFNSKSEMYGGSP